MKIAEILSQVNTFEKNHFLRSIEQVISGQPKNIKKIEKILSEIDGQIRNADYLSVESVFSLIEDEYIIQIKKEFASTTSQLDLLIDILIRDGNSLMSREWLLKLYEKEIRSIKSKIKEVNKLIDDDDTDLRTRDYRIYRSCVKTAFNNDRLNNRDSKVTEDEQSILNTLIDSLDLSHEEVKLINYSVIPLKKIEIDELITYLVKVGIIMYSKKHHKIYVPDQVILALRKIRGREVSDKVFRRVLRQLKDSQINMLARKHNIDRKLTVEQKIKEIIKEGVSFRKMMLQEIHKDGTSKTDKKAVLQELIDKKLKIEERIKGASLEDKFENLLDYFIRKDNEDAISISLHGFDKLLLDLKKEIKGFGKQFRGEFELQENVEMNAKNLLMHSLKPIDVLYILDDDQVRSFCENKEISIRGNKFKNILDRYKDAQNLFLENYINISNRDLNALKISGIEFKESELGIQYEELTKLVFKKLGLDVNEELRKKINTSKDKIDILIKLDDDDIIIVECKTKKDRKFNTYSSASRQVKAYKDLAARSNMKVSKTFIVAPSFSDDFINECGLDYELNLSLITSESLIDIYNAFLDSELKEFPYKILLRDVLIDSKRVIKSISK